jgi:hypothetical protein
MARFIITVAGSTAAEKAGITTEAQRGRGREEEKQETRAKINADKRR